MYKLQLFCSKIILKSTMFVTLFLFSVNNNLLGFKVIIYIMNFSIRCEILIFMQINFKILSTSLLFILHLATTTNLFIILRLNGIDSKTNNNNTILYKNMIL